MNEREKYLFDVQGYLIVRNFLTPAEVARLNAAFDANRALAREDGNSYTGKSETLKAERKRGYFDGMLTWERPWCDPFRELFAHPKAIPYLDTMLGRGWRMDHAPFMLCGGEGAEGLKLHGPGHNFDGSQYYVYKNGMMRCGMIVFQYQLADVIAGQGGFCCIPGSHKANFACPQEISGVGGGDGVHRQSGLQVGRSADLQRGDHAWNAALESAARAPVAALPIFAQVSALRGRRL